MAPLAKIGAGVLTIGTVGGVGYGIVAYSQQQKTVISDLIKKEYQYILLDTDSNKDDTTWDAIWKSYKSDHSQKEKNIFGLDGWTKAGDEDLKDKLKLKCKELATKNVYDNKDETYKQVTSYCARGVSIKDEATNRSFRVVDVNTGDTTIWQARLRDKTRLEQHLNALDAKDPALNEDKIKTKCKEAENKTKQDENYSAIFEAYQAVCIKQTGEV